MTVLKLRLRQPLEEKGNRSSIVANIYDLERTRYMAHQARQIRNAIIPLSNDDWDWGEFDLPPGRYLVEALLPSGETVTDEVRLEPTEPERKVVLEGPTSIPQLAGLAEPKLRPLALRAELRPVETRVDLILLPSPPPGVVESTSFLSWSHLRQLVMSTPENSTSVFQRTLNEDTSRPTSVTPAKPAESTLGGTVYHFAQPGAVPSDYDTRHTSGYDYDYANSRLRFFATVSVNGFVRETVALPIPWFQINHSGEAMVDLLVTPDRLSPREHRGSVIIRDQQMAGFLGYLAAGDLPNAAIVARPAKELLFEKFENPFAAAAGAYVLLSQIKEEEDFRREPWHRWVRNLMNSFPWIPDGAIQYGWLKLREGAESEACSAFLEAFSRGVPFYSLGVRWLLDGLTVVRSSKSAAWKCEEVRKVALHTDMSQPFSSIRLGVLRGT